MYCPHCGASVSEQSRFCPECGGRLQDLGNTEIVPEEEVRLDDIVGEEATQAPASEPPATEALAPAEIVPDLSQFQETPGRRVVAEVVGEEPARKKNDLAKWLVIAGAAVLVVCTCCFLSFILFFSTGNSY